MYAFRLICIVCILGVLQELYVGTMGHSETWIHTFEVDVHSKNISRDVYIIYLTYIPHTYTHVIAMKPAKLRH